MKYFLRAFLFINFYDKGGGWGERVIQLLQIILKQLQNDVSQEFKSNAPTNELTTFKRVI